MCWGGWSTRAYSCFVVTAALTMTAGCAAELREALPAHEPPEVAMSADQSSQAAAAEPEAVLAVVRRFLESPAAVASGELAFARMRVANPPLAPAVRWLAAAEAGTSHLASARIIYGTAEDVQKLTGCWLVDYPGLLNETLAGCVAGAPLALIALWVEPEG